VAKEYNKIEVKNNMNVESEEVSGESTPEKKDLKKLVGKQPKKRKQNLATRLIKGVLGPEGLPGIGSYVNDEIIIPAIKNIIVDAVTSGINMVMYGEKGGPPRGGGNYASYSRNRTTYRPNTNYAGRYASSHQEPPAERRVSPGSRRYGVEEYIIDERFDAAHVLTTLTENADMYGSVSVADYYDLIGVASNFTDNSYGWTIDSITQTSIVPVRGGYILKFPPVEVI